MICPMCLGKGYATDEDIKEYPHRCPNCNGKGFYSVDWQKVRCEVCNGSGKKPMTNEEWFDSLTTEEKAKFICNLMKGDDLYLGVMSARDMIKDELNHGKDGSFVIYEWLKEIHE